jgi:hypothetical protein
MLDYNSSLTQCQHPLTSFGHCRSDRYNRGQRSAWKPSHNDMSTMPAKGNSGELIRTMSKAGINDDNEPIPVDKLDEINIEVSARAAAHTLALAMGSRQDSAVQITAVCAENLIRVDDVTESPKLVE